jgi:RsiW-degrading membrane proteinase PrsW (M82 family)
MKSSPGRYGGSALIPEDPNVAWWLVLVSIVTVVLACALSGASLKDLAIGPRAYIRSVMYAATSRSEPFFWLVWILLSVGLIAFAAAIVVVYAALSAR